MNVFYSRLLLIGCCGLMSASIGASAHYPFVRPHAPAKECLAYDPDDDLVSVLALPGSGCGAAPVHAEPFNPTWGFSELSDWLLKNKAEFMGLGVSDIETQVKLNSIKEGRGRTNNFMYDTQTVTQQAAWGVTEALIPAEYLTHLFQEYTRRVIDQHSNAAEWIDEGTLFGLLRTFQENLPVDQSQKTVPATIPFLEKRIIAPGEKLICIGDLHGSLHSLLRNLWHMVEQGQLADDFSLTPGNRLIFLGDLVDRGTYGIEVIALLLRLKLKNWDAVDIIRGNHEDVNDSGFFLCDRFGFSAEVSYKYPGDINVLFECKKFFLSLPQALFIGISPPAGGSLWWMQCSHGGVDPFTNIRAFLGSDAASAHNSDKKYAWIEQLRIHEDQEPASWRVGDGFNWSDVTGVAAQSTYQERSFTWGKEFLWYTNKRGAGICASIDNLDTYLYDNGLKCLVRGHQDAGFSFKTLVDGVDNPQTWRCDPSLRRKSPAQMFVEGFKPSDEIEPCFTCTSAAEGKCNLNEGYIELVCAATYADSTFKVYENHLSLPPTDAAGSFILDGGSEGVDVFYLMQRALMRSAFGRFGKFVAINPRDNRFNDPLAPLPLGSTDRDCAVHRWVDSPVHAGVHAELVAKAKANIQPGKQASPAPGLLPDSAAGSRATITLPAASPAGSPEGSPVSLVGARPESFAPPAVLAPWGSGLPQWGARLQPFQPGLGGMLFMTDSSWGTYLMPGFATRPAPSNSSVGAPIESFSRSSWQSGAGHPTAYSPAGQAARVGGAAASGGAHSQVPADDDVDW
jgi:hypothetical protein